MRFSARLAILILTLCACGAKTPAARTPGATSVVLGEEAAPTGYVELRELAVKSGKGCGVFGEMGSREGAEARLRDEAAKLGASYVRVTSVQAPRPNHQCIEHEYGLTGVAYRAAPPEPEPTPSAAALAPQSEAVIRLALTEQAEAWNRHDAKAWVAPFAEDAEFINILGSLLLGRDEIERRHTEIFGGIFSHSRVVVTTRKLRLLGTDTAITETDYELRDYARLPPGIAATDPDGTLRTRMKYVWLRTDATWRVVAAQNTALLPPPPQP